MAAALCLGHAQHRVNRDREGREAMQNRALKTDTARIDRIDGFGFSAGEQADPLQEGLGELHLWIPRLG